MIDIEVKKKRQQREERGVDKVQHLIQWAWYNKICSILLREPSLAEFTSNQSVEQSWGLACRCHPREIEELDGMLCEPKRRISLFIDLFGEKTVCACDRRRKWDSTIREETVLI